jgi:hypothetical protein
MLVFIRVRCRRVVMWGVSRWMMKLGRVAKGRGSVICLNCDTMPQDTLQENTVSPASQSARCPRKECVDKEEALGSILNSGSAPLQRRRFPGTGEWLRFRRLRFRGTIEHLTT